MKRFRIDGRIELQKAVTELFIEATTNLILSFKFSVQMFFRNNLNAKVTESEMKTLKINFYFAYFYLFVIKQKTKGAGAKIVGQ